MRGEGRPVQQKQNRFGSVREVELLLSQRGLAATDQKPAQTDASDQKQSSTNTNWLDLLQSPAGRSASGAAANKAQRHGRLMSLNSLFQ